jgi:hypothetical protein
MKIKDDIHDYTMVKISFYSSPIILLIFLSILIYNNNKIYNNNFREIICCVNGFCLMTNNNTCNLLIQFHQNYNKCFLQDLNINQLNDKYYYNNSFAIKYK